VAQPGQQLELSLEPGPPITQQPAPTPTVAPTARAATPRADPTAHAHSRSPAPPQSHVRRSTGYVAIGTGAAAVVASLVLGYTVIRASETVSSSCERIDGENLCSEEGLAAQRRGKTLATAADISFAAGAVLSGIGVYLVLSSGDAEPPRGALLGTRMAW
jgi:hypothetical protein